jgi:hypothetical protein
MDYRDKYTKYQIKNIDITNQNGGGKQIMFVMFPGFEVSKKEWDCYFEKDKKIKTNFINELKKMGSIYFHEPLYHNIKYYEGSEQSKYLYNKNIDFTKENFDVIKECDKVYQQIKDFKGMFVPIGHSIGSYFVYCFQQKYSSNCLFSVIIDGSAIGPIEQTPNDKKYLYPNIKKYQKYDDQMIEQLKDKVRESDEKAAQKIIDIAFYNILSYKKITNDADQFKKPLIGFYNMKISDDTNKKKLKMNHLSNIRKSKEIDHFMKHNDNYHAITFVNKTHFPHYINDSREIILDYIKKMIDQYS